MPKWSDVTAGMQSRAVTVYGEDFTWSPTGGAPRTVLGIFRDAFVSVDVEGEQEIQHVQPQLDVRESDLAGDDPQEGTWTRDADGKVYKSREPQPDGEGMLKLLLYAVPS